MGDPFEVAHCRYCVSSMPSRRLSVRCIASRIKIFPCLIHQQLSDRRQMLNRQQHLAVRAFQYPGKTRNQDIQGGKVFAGLI